MKKKWIRDALQYGIKTKSWKIMRLSAFFLFLFLSQVWAENGYSQLTKLTLKMDNARVIDVLDEIENNSEFYFLFNQKLVDVERKVTVDVKEKTIDKILSDIFSGTDVSYLVRDRLIVLTTEKMAPLNEFLQSQQQRTVSGTVTDESGQPLLGVTVVVKGTAQGTVTNAEGNYSIIDIPENATLLFSFVGMVTQEIEVGDQSSIDVTLVVDAIGIEEVVAIGYGTQKRVNLTGAVDVVSNRQIESRQSITVSQILQGQSPGIDFSIDRDGFQPGAEMDIDIRGVGSINGGSPYILIDGFPGDMNRLNPEDIESISVLKDAAASAIYGARAPYGVILITTKSGKRNEKFSSTYSGSVSVNTPQRLPEMLDSYTYARVINEAGENRGGRIYSDESINRIIAYQNGDIEYLKQFMPDDVIYYETIPRGTGLWAIYNECNADYDWFDEYYGNSVNQKHNFSFQGGTQNSSYYFSAGYAGQEGVLNYGVDTYQRANVIGKLNTAIASWWDFRYEPRFMKSKRIMTNMDKQGSYGLMFHQIARTMPNQSKYDGYGNYSIQSKIPWTQDAGTDNIELTENYHTFATEIRPLKNWKINADFAYKSVDMFRSDQELTVYEIRVDGSPVASGNTVPSNVQQFHHSNYYWTTNAYSSYNLNLKDVHNFSLLMGTQFEYNAGRSMDANKNDIIVPEVISLQTALGDPAVYENLSHWATEGYFGRFTYNYKEKYLVEANARYDGTSVFRQGKRWGFFPSFSLGWNIYKESFWEPLENVINTCKFRGSWGQLGNQQVAAYQDLELIPLQSGKLNWIFNYGLTRPVGYTTTPSLISPDLTWETASTKNLGVNMTFFKSRLQADFDWFERLTTLMIGPSEAKAGVLGATVPRSNNSTLRTRGWELSLKWRQNLNNGLSYYVDVNLFDNTSVVTKYLNPTGILSTWYEGKEQGEIWGFKVNDLYRTQEEVDEYLAEIDLSPIYNTWRPGDIKYEDTNGDGKIDWGSNTLNDHGDMSIIGNDMPHYQFGISSGINYKEFDFSMLWSGTAKRDLFMNPNQNIYWGFRTYNQSSVFPWHLDYYRDKPGDKYTGVYEGEENINTDAYWPRPYLNNPENQKNRRASTRYLQDGSFIRLQNVQLGYTLSDDLISKLRLQKMRIYLSGENLLTLTSLSKGIDPVAVSGQYGIGKTYGADRIFSLGIIVTY